MNGPRIIRTVAEEPANKPALHIDIGGLPPYSMLTEPRQKRVRRSRRPALLAATVGLGLVLLPLSAALAVTMAPKPTAQVQREAPAPHLYDLQSSGRLGRDLISCSNDNITITVSYSAQPAGVAVGRVEAPGGFLPFTLRPTPSGFAAQLLVGEGQIRPAAEPGQSLAIKPGERVIVSIRGVELARVLTVLPNRDLQLGAEAACS